MENTYYISIDLKSFYASVECIDRGLNPMTTHLVVADESRTDKTICLAVSPALKAYGVPGRPRLFEVLQRVKEINATRRYYAPNHTLTSKSCFDEQVKNDKSVALDFLIAPPRMARYMEVSTAIYHIYTQFVAPEDIHVYSIDEIFCDVTKYLKSYRLTARELAARMVSAVFRETGVTATAGVGSNLYLSKVAMDIVAKHAEPDENGVRIAELSEEIYRSELWDHRPLTDFWRVGKGYARKLERYGLYTMGDIARCSLQNEELLYRAFGVNAELLIDHAWGWEPCTVKEIKQYRPQEHSIGSGQVLTCGYDFEKGLLVAKEMADALALELVEKRFVTNQIVLTVGYDIENLRDPARRENYRGEVVEDRYGRTVPKSAHGTFNLEGYTSSTRLIMEATAKLYCEIVAKDLLVRRMYLVATHVVDAEKIPPSKSEQLDLFTDYELREEQTAQTERTLKKEKNVQKAVLSIQKKFGKNALIKGMNLEEGATAVERNGQIGGHKKG